MMASVQDIAQAVSDIIKGALGVSLSDLIIQILATVLLVIIVRHFLWNKITAYLENRRKFIESEIENAKNENLEASKNRLETEKECEEMRSKSLELLKSTKLKAEQERSVILSEAKLEANRVLKSSLINLEKETEKAKSQIKNDVVVLASLMAEKIINKSIDPADYQSLSISMTEGSEDK
ncbi:MAG: ATP synthase F0 subunit B [Tenericutes bacterium HGW-Tenericutes-1]|nr:MAG: ATP synthase F0 subunit B [Tenericutes bacterium HGW-Tenericutes-1]